MKEILSNGIELIIENAGQILNMGGPWIGDVSNGDDLISKDCIVDNFVYKEDLDLLFFVKYNRVSKYQWYFSINFYQFKTKNVYQFEKVFSMVHLKEFLNKKDLLAFLAFHDKFPEKGFIFDIDEEEFSLVTQLI